MDQPVTTSPSETASETNDDIMDAVTRDDTIRRLERDGKEPVVVMSVPAYWRLKLGPAPEWLQESWRRAKEDGLDKMTMDEIDAEIAAARRERKEAETKQP